MGYDYGDEYIMPLTAEMCQHFPPPEYLIQGMLSNGKLACFFGAPGAGKSLFALRVAYAVSRGDSISGFSTKKGPVLYLAYEDYDGVAYRVAGLYNCIGPVEPNTNFKLMTEVGNLYDDDDGGNSHPICKLAKYARENLISLIVIDTLAIAFAGVEENDHKSMGRVIERAKYLAEKSGAAVILVHHGTKSEIGTPTPRGSGTLNAALDLVLHIRQTSSGRIEVRSTKVKNGSNDICLSYKIRAVQIGVDFNDDPITAGVCEESDKNDRSQPHSKAELAVLQILDELQRRGPVSERELMATCAASNNVSSASQQTDRTRVCRRVFQNLIGRGLVVSISGLVSKVDQ